jgi:hypothetical protein
VRIIGQFKGFQRTRHFMAIWRWKGIKINHDISLFL